MTQNEIKDEVLRRNPEISEEQYDLVIQDFYLGLRKYITNPQDTKGGILISGLFSLSLRKYKIEKMIDWLKDNNNKIKRKNPTTQEFYEELLEQVKRYERQTSK